MVIVVIAYSLIWLFVVFVLLRLLLLCVDAVCDRLLVVVLVVVIVTCW